MYEIETDLQRLKRKSANRNTNSWEKRENKRLKHKQAKLKHNPHD